MTGNTTTPTRRALPPSTAMVVELGRSVGSSPTAAGLALALARQLDAPGWVLLAELNPRGGDLLERLAFGRVPRIRFTPDLPSGAAQLAEHLASLEFAGGFGDDAVTAHPVLSDYLVEMADVPGVRVLLGDHLVEGASRAAAVIPPHLAPLAEGTGAVAVVIDGGSWSSAQPERLAVADVVYAVIQATSASQNARCLAELSALWRLLDTSERPRRLVAVVTDPVGDTGELADLFNGAVRPGDQRRYRVAVLDGRHERRVLARLAAGQWRGLSPRDLQCFGDLVSPLMVRPDRSIQAEPPPARAPTAEPVVDEHAYLAATVPPTPPVVDEQLRSPMERPSSGTGIVRDPGLWPFEDGVVPDDSRMDGGRRPDAAGPEPAPAHNGGHGRWQEESSPAVRAAREAPLACGPPPLPPRRLRRANPQEGTGS